MSSRHDEMRQQVIEFHQANPVVWELFVKFTFDRIQRGFKHYSVNGLFERIRWETSQAKPGEDTFKLNNNYRAFYARAFMRKYPEHEGIFRTRQQTSQDRGDTGLPELKPSHFDSRNQTA